jgi:bile-salt sulfotransferase
MIKVYGHPRSGNNLLMATCAVNFYAGADLSKDGTVGHWRNPIQGHSKYGQLAGGHMFYSGQELDGLPLYIFRDGRDVAVSLWKTKAMLPPECHDISFHDFLWMPLDWIGTPGKPAEMGARSLNIVEHWRKHLEAWGKSPATIVRYEKLVLDAPSIVRDIALRLLLPPMNNVEIISERVGWFPNDAAIGTWKDLFTYNDLLYFYGIVPRDFWGLWAK